MEPKETVAVEEPENEALPLDDLPKEIRQVFETEFRGEPAEPIKAEPAETVKAAEKVEAEPAKVTPTDLDAERERRRPAREPAETTFDTVEQIRARYAEAVQRQPEAKKREPRDYNTAKDWNEAVAWLREDLDGEYGARLAAIQGEAKRDVLRVQETTFARDNKDFYDVIKKSGVWDDIETANGTRAPRDAFLHNFIYAQPNPPAALYDYAKGRLSKRETGEAVVQGKEEGRREVIEAIDRNARRAVSISGLPSSSGREVMTVRDIGRLSDDSKRWLKKNRPDLWAKYLGKPA